MGKQARDEEEYARQLTNGVSYEEIANRLLACYGKGFDNCRHATTEGSRRRHRIPKGMEHKIWYDKIVNTYNEQKKDKKKIDPNLEKAYNRIKHIDPPK